MKVNNMSDADLWEELVYAADQAGDADLAVEARRRYDRLKEELSEAFPWFDAGGDAAQLDQRAQEVEERRATDVPQWF